MKMFMTALVALMVFGAPIAKATEIKCDTTKTDVMEKGVKQGFSMQPLDEKQVARAIKAYNGTKTGSGTAASDQFASDEVDSAMIAIKEHAPGIIFFFKETCHTGAMFYLSRPQLTDIMGDPT